MMPLVLRNAARLLVGAIWIGALGVGCGAGKLTIQLDRPSKPELDPMSDARLSKFSLRVTQDGTVTDQDAFRGGDEELTVGTIPTEAPFDLRLAGKTAADDMLGLGLVLDVTAPEQGETVVGVKFRMPMGYVAAGSGVQVLNTAANLEGSVELPAIPVAGASDLASTPNGALVLVVAEKSLVPIRTADHVALPKVNLPAAGACIGVTPDSRFALICHRKERTVTIVDLDVIGTGKESVATVPVPGEPTRVAFGTDRRIAKILLGGVGPMDTCGGAASQLASFDMLSRTPLDKKDLGRQASDLAIDPRDGAVLLALPCEKGSLGRVLPNGQAGEVADLPAPYDIAVTDQGIVAIGGGVDKLGQVAGQVVVFDPNKGFTAPQTKTFPIPPLSVGFQSNSASPGYLSWVSDPSDLRVLDLSVAPDGRRAIVLFRATYASNMSFNACLFETNVQGTGYLLVDLVTGSLLSLRYTRLRFTKCRANCLAQGGVPMDTLERCEPAFKAVMQGLGLLIQPEFEVGSSTLLFGGT
jgi:hypothetical protein